MDAVQFLKQEHQKAKAGFEKVMKAPPGQRGGLWDALTPELALHEQIEDACVYEPLAQDAEGVDSVLAEWKERHEDEVEKLDELLEAIEDLDPEHDDWLAKVTEVHTSLRRHIEEEEGDIFPRMSKVWDRTRLEKAGSDLKEMKTAEAGAD